MGNNISMVVKEYTENPEIGCIETCCCYYNNNKVVPLKIVVNSALPVIKDY